MENVCRTCLRLIGSTYSITYLNKTNKKSEAVSIREKLESCVPELTLDIVAEPTICSTCASALTLAYQFKSTCIQTEKTLYACIKRRQKQTPGYTNLLTAKDLAKIARNDIEFEHNYSYTDRYSPMDTTASESDGNGFVVESSPVRFSDNVKSSFNAVTKESDTEPSPKKEVTKRASFKENQRDRSKEIKKNEQEAPRKKPDQTKINSKDIKRNESVIKEEQQKLTVSKESSNQFKLQMKELQESQKVLPTKVVEAKHQTRSSSLNKRKTMVPVKEVQKPKESFVEQERRKTMGSLKEVQDKQKNVEFRQYEAKSVITSEKQKKQKANFKDVFDEIKQQPEQSQKKEVNMTGIDLAVKELRKAANVSIQDKPKVVTLKESPSGILQVTNQKVVVEQTMQQQLPKKGESKGAKKILKLSQVVVKSPTRDKLKTTSGEAIHNVNQSVDQHVVVEHIIQPQQQQKRESRSTQRVTKELQKVSRSPSQDKFNLVTLEDSSVHEQLVVEQSITESKEDMEYRECLDKLMESCSQPNESESLKVDIPKEKENSFVESPMHSSTPRTKRVAQHTVKFNKTEDDDSSFIDSPDKSISPVSTKDISSVSATPPKPSPAKIATALDSSPSRSTRSFTNSCNPKKSVKVKTSSKKSISKAKSGRKLSKKEIRAAAKKNLTIPVKKSLDKIIQKLKEHAVNDCGRIVNIDNAIQKKMPKILPLVDVSTSPNKSHPTTSKPQVGAKKRKAFNIERRQVGIKRSCREKRKPFNVKYEDESSQDEKEETKLKEPLKTVAMSDEELADKAIKLVQTDGNVIYKCTRCSKTFRYKSHFQVHERAHILTKLFNCTLCNKTFTHEKHLRAHQMMHKNLGAYKCRLCSKRLSSTTALKRHLVTHTGEKAYTCSVCDKAFAQKVQLSVHMRIHTGLKPYSCDICDATFTQKSHLMGHVKIHTGEKPFKCDLCWKQFRKSYALSLHKECHIRKPYQCRSCDFLVKDIPTFKRHIHKHLLGRLPLKNKTNKPRQTIINELKEDFKNINKLKYEVKVE